ncbi:hypothetical protein RN001_015144 [Aquatica leii]|uniref:Cytochrome P450 n=1 Tax=Aquatica leii TaxID=1421715 RepID=A0AAN7NVB2_9COLE|nr:hypothetical protein RN001_015144 [Aquatica leii]
MLFETVLMCAKDLITIVDNAAEMNEKIEIKDISSRLAIDVIASCVFGIKADSLKNPNSKIKKIVTEYFEISTRNAITLLLAVINPKILAFFKIKVTSKNVSDFFMNLVKTTVNHRETNSLIRKDFIHLLLQIKNNAKINDDSVGGFQGTDLAPQLTIEEMAAQCLVFFIGGFETVCCTITYCLYELAKNPAIQKKAREEVQKCLMENSENDQLTYAVLQKMCYIDQVVYETLRFYPPVSGIIRECSKDYIIPNTNVRIEKGCSLLIPTLGIHRDPDIYPNPDEFDPERFSPEIVKNRHACAWMPFGEGPRNCIAYQFGVMETKMAIATILNRLQNMEPVTIYSIIFVIATTIWSFFKWKFTYWQRRGVYSPRPTIPFGNAFNLISQKRSIGLEMRYAYQDIKNRSLPFGGYYFLTHPVLLPTDLDLIQRISTTDFEHFSDRTLMTIDNDPLSGNLFALKGQEWQNTRSKLSPAFTPSKNKMMFGTVKKHTDVLLEIVNEFCAKKESIDLHDLMVRTTVDVICACAFGLDSNSLRNPNSKLKEYGLRYFEPTTRRKIVFLFTIIVPKLLKLFHIRTFPKDISDFFLNVMTQTVNHRETNKIIQKDFVHLLLQIKNNSKITADEVGSFEKTSDQKSTLTIQEITAHSVVFFVGGAETSGGILTFCLYELTLQKQIQDTARKEVQNALHENGGELTYQLLQKLPYLGKCINETMRKYPVVPMHLRECTKDYIVPNTNVHIKKGSTVFVSAFGIHRDPELYPDPEKFDPERFSEENVKSRHPYAFIPFGMGPKICLAYTFGIMEIKLVMATLLANFKFSLNPKTKPLEFNPKSMPTLPLTAIWIDVTKV